MSQDIDRRSFVGAAAASTVAATTGMLGVVGAAEGAETRGKKPGKKFRRIATEEAFNIPEIAEAYAVFGRSTWDSLDNVLNNILYSNPTGPIMPDIHRRLLDFDNERLQIMDRDSVDMHVLSLTCPGVQVFDPDTATSLATLVNDRLADAIKRHPTRYAGLGCFAPQDPKRAVKEMERSIRELKLNGFILNSHTQGEYLDNQKFWPILEAAEALGAPIYLHPRSPSRQMQGGFDEYNLHAAMWGYAVETGTHALRIMMSGALDRFPKLQIVLGHMGELIPFHLWRIDYMATRGFTQRAGLKLIPSEYYKRNFAITTSGVEDHLALKFCIDKLGVDNVMWAIDYPYQPSEPATTFMNTAPISDADKEKIFHKNAERIFRIAT